MRGRSISQGLRCQVRSAVNRLYPRGSQYPQPGEVTRTFAEAVRSEKGDRPEVIVHSVPWPSLPGLPSTPASGDEQPASRGAVEPPQQGTRASGSGGQWIKGDELND